jgi:hypothetical protein
VKEEKNGGECSGTNRGEYEGEPRCGYGHGRVKSYDTYFEDPLDRWKNKIYEVSTRICAHISVEEKKEYFGSYLYDGLDMVETLRAWI